LPRTAHRVEAQALALQFGSFAGLAQEQEPGLRVKAGS
jgi:hypothetical protein